MLVIGCGLDTPKQVRKLKTRIIGLVDRYASSSSHIDMLGRLFKPVPKKTAASVLVGTT